MQILNDAEFYDASVELWTSAALRRYKKDFAEPWARALSRASYRRGMPNLACYIILWQAFWEELPNDNSIRSSTFFRICDLAEYTCFSRSQPEPQS